MMNTHPGGGLAFKTVFEMCSGSRLVTFAFIILATLIAAGCGSQAGNQETASLPSQRGGLSGSQAPDVLLEAYQGADVLGGERVRLADLTGQGKPVVLNFWAGLCPPCRAEMPDFEKVHQQFHGRVLIVGADIGPYVGLGSTEDGKALLRQLKVTYPAGLAADGSVVRAYGILGMPTTVFIKPDGTVFRSHSGLLNEAQLTSAVKELLKAS